MTYQDFKECRIRIMGQRGVMTEQFNDRMPAIWNLGRYGHCYLQLLAVRLLIWNSCFASPSNVSFDETTMKALLDTEERSFIPDKPDPNGIEFFGVCDSSKFLYRILWEKPTYICKYTRPVQMADLIKAVVKDVIRRNTNEKTVESRIWAIDARFSSLEAAKILSRPDLPHSLRSPLSPSGILLLHVCHRKEARSSLVCYSSR